MGKPLLLIEDDLTQAAFLKVWLEDLPLNVIHAQNAVEAFEALEKNDFQVAICDIHLDGQISGIEVLKKMMQYQKAPVAIMLTADGNSKVIIESMRLGAFDYIIKPVDQKDFRIALERALAKADTEDAAREVEKARVKQAETQLATRRITEGLMRRHNNKFARALFGNIYTSFTQGKGIGAMTTLGSLLVGSPKTADGTSYIVPADLIGMISENQAAVDDMIAIFRDLQLLVSQESVLHDVALGEFHGIIRDLIYELKPMADKNSHRIVMSELNPRFSGGRLKLNWEFMRKALRELLLNALKFSPHETTVTVLVEYLYTRVQITILNTPLPGSPEEPAGIPEEYRKVLFEPFFRLSRVVHEQYGTLEYGLGLTFVEKIVQMHKGDIRCTTVRDFKQEDGDTPELIAFEIELPS